MTALTALSWKSLNNATVVSSTQAYMLLATTRIVFAAVLRTSRIPYAADRWTLSLEPNDSGDAESPGTGRRRRPPSCMYLPRAQAYSAVSQHYRAMGLKLWTNANIGDACIQSSDRSTTATGLWLAV